MAFLIYEYGDYKQVIKERLKDLKKSRAKFTLQFLADVLDIQYTFLSKILNSETTHLNEDHIFSVGEALEFLEDEIEFLYLLRSHQATQNKNRKTKLFQKISALQKKNSLSLNAAQSTPSQLVEEMRYLMDYQAVVVHAALSIKSVQRNPQVLLSLMRLEPNRLKEILFLLDRMGRIEYDAKNNQIKKLIHGQLHFGKDHPLTRTHQLVMKTALNQVSFGKSEDKKENLFATFTTDAAGFEKIKKQLKDFTSQVQKITFDHKHTGVYQLNLDFLELFES